MLFFRSGFNLQLLKRALKRPAGRLRTVSKGQDPAKSGFAGRGRI